MKKILVTGGSGFLGHHLINALLSSGNNVRSLDLHESSIKHEQLEFIKGSFTNHDLIDEALTGCDVVFHLASTTIPKTSNDNPLFDINTNLIGTVTMLDLAVSKKIDKFIFISSGGTVYGSPTQLPVPEDHQTNATCSYGVIKLAIEKYLQIYHQQHGLNTCSLRLSNPYGEYQRADSGLGAVTAFCHKALNDEPIEIWGDGSVIRDFIYVKDAVNAMILAMDSDCSGLVINIGYGSGTSLNQLIEKIEMVCGHELQKAYYPGRCFDVPEIYLDINRAKNILGWEPTTSLDDGIKLLLENIRCVIK
ncbi:MAG: NAD-dependent epimerase/dehydratase family protein, partial [Thiotrichaceae bacterium]|nr:NAD-dependent epimerase/dehydratase family protein [Thiotrichaceae bacterium]